MRSQNLRATRPYLLPPYLALPPQRKARAREDAMSRFAWPAIQIASPKRELAHSFPKLLDSWHGLYTHARCLTLLPNHSLAHHLLPGSPFAPRQQEEGEAIHGEDHREGNAVSAM